LDEAARKCMESGYGYNKLMERKWVWRWRVSWCFRRVAEIVKINGTGKGGFPYLTEETESQFRVRINVE